jgi:hypothetical protein
MRELPPTVPLALDVFASPESWALPNPKLRTAGHEPNIVPYMLMLGGRPCSYTGSVTCMAVSIAIDLGATTVALAGFDCGYASDGAVYARHTPFEGLRATETGDGLMGFDGCEAKIRTPTAALRAEGTRFASGDVLTEHVLVSFAEWLARVAQRRTIVAVGSRGLRIPHVADVSEDEFAAFIQGPRVAFDLPPPIPSEVVLAVLDRIEADARDKLDSGAIYPQPGDPLLNLWIVPRMLGITRTTSSPADRVRAIRKALVTGCEQVIEGVTAARKMLLAEADASKREGTKLFLSSEIDLSGRYQ